MSEEPTPAQMEDFNKLCEYNGWRVMLGYGDDWGRGICESGRICVGPSCYRVNLEAANGTEVTAFGASLGEAQSRAVAAMTAALGGGQRE